MSNSSTQIDDGYAEASKRIEILLNLESKPSSLDLSSLGLAQLPPSIGQLESLTTLNLDNNQLTTLPSPIAKLGNLKWLYLSRNKLLQIPPEIGQLHSLIFLYLNNNHLTELPSEIEKLRSLQLLDLRRNQLVKLPIEITELGSLEKLYLHDNPKLGLPDSLLGPNFSEWMVQLEDSVQPSDILNFYFAKQKAATAGTLRPLNEMKVMLVGRRGAGKTSLRRYLMNQPHNSNEKETPGITLESFNLNHGQREITIRLWDFTDEEITHPLHQVFLTENCIYILMLDPHLGMQEREAEYWLNLLSRYARNAPILVALNHQDAHRDGYDVDRNALKDRFPSLQTFIPTNFETRKGCDELNTALKKVIDSLSENEPPHLEVPESWLKVKRECFKHQDGNPENIKNRQELSGNGTPSRRNIRQYLTLQKFRELCHEYGETKEDNQDLLVRVLHQLGVVLYFADNPQLCDTVVLNPHWLTEGVNRLMQAKNQPGSDGILSFTDAQNTLPNETESGIRFLLNLMERFEMCFPIKEDEANPSTSNWLVPRALNPFQPSDVGPGWSQIDRVRLLYKYVSLPEGLLPRFIGLTHPQSENQPRWRNGAVLQVGEARSLVRKLPENVIEVIVIGPPEDRYRLLEIVRGNLDRIHTGMAVREPVLEIEGEYSPDTFRSKEEGEPGKKMAALRTESSTLNGESTPVSNRPSESNARSRIPLKVFLSYVDEDEKARKKFQSNLKAMIRSNYVHEILYDQKIKPEETQWKKQIEEHLENMDVFVGLLTTAFLAEFIQTDEWASVRKKLKSKRVDFLFVLILMDDISLEGLDTAEYKILKPSGKGVRNHSPHRNGFYIVQKELEKVFQKRQELKKADATEATQTKVPSQSTRTDINLHIHANNLQNLALRDILQGANQMIDDHSIKARDIINSQVGQTLTNSTNMITQQPPGERKQLLEGLQSDVKKLIESLPEEKKEEAPEVGENLELLVKSATSEKPNRRFYSVSAQGLLEASKWVKDFSGNIFGTIVNLGKNLWPDFPKKDELEKK
jgi:internalin A